MVWPPVAYAESGAFIGAHTADRSDYCCEAVSPHFEERAAQAASAARAGALPEVVGEAGLLVDPRRPEAIASAMGACGREPALSRAAALEGPRRAAGFSWQESAASVEALLRELA